MGFFWKILGKILWKILTGILSKTSSTLRFFSKILSFYFLRSFRGSHPIAYSIFHQGSYKGSLQRFYRASTSNISIPTAIATAIATAVATATATAISIAISIAIAAGTDDGDGREDEGRQRRSIFTCV